MRALCPLLILTSFWLPQYLGAQTPDVGFGKGDSVVLVVPTKFLQVRQTGLGGMNLKLDVETRIGGGVVEVQQASDSAWRRDWRSAGFPSVRHYAVANLKTVDRNEAKFIEVTLKDRPPLDLRYRFFAPADQAAAIRAILAPVRAADSVLQMAYDSLGARFFTGPLASFTPAERLLLLRFAHLTANGTKLGSETFKGITYLTIALPGDGNTWNDLRVTRTQRIGRLIGDQLTLLKAFAKIAVPHDSIGGLKLEQPSRHGMAPYYVDATDEEVAAYFPLDAMLRFATVDITSQQLVNQGIVLVNGNRVAVDLSTQ